MTTETALPPAVGTVAPDFTLQSTIGEPVTLSSFRGYTNVLVAFFPLAFSSTCTAELCDMGTEFDQFVGRGAKLLPVSVDSTYSLVEYKKKYKMPFEMLSDFKREASRAYGVLIEDRFYSNRAYFLVDRNGVVRWSHIEDNPGMKRENRELLEAIDALE